MGAGLLLRYAREDDPSAEQQFRRVANAFPRRLRSMTQGGREDSRCRVVVWTHPACRTPGFVLDSSTGSWLALVGNPARRDLTALSGTALLQRLLRACLDHGASALDDVSPPFAAVLYDARTGQLSAAVDRIGFQHLYLREDGNAIWLSSSSLALGTALRSTVDPAAISEWLGVGNFISGRTFFREVRKLGAGERLAVDDDRLASAGRGAVEGSWTEGLDPVEAFVESFRRSLDDYAHGPGLFAELTAGIDSRFVLAGLLEREQPFSTWTVAHRQWDELNTIRQLRGRVTFDHALIEVGSDLGQRLPELVDEMHELGDGESNALEYAPLLIAFERLEGTRVTSITGTAGEIARGFFYSTLGAVGNQERRVSLDALVSKTTRPTRPLHGNFVVAPLQEPRDAAREVLADFIRASPAATEVGILEDLYLRGRLQRFAGRNFSTTGYFCRQGLPYFGNDFVDLVLALPMQTKKGGWVLRRALQKLSPELASVPLTAGEPVEPSSRLALVAGLRRSLALGRRGAARYGGPRTRALLARGVENLPGAYARRSQAFEDYARDLLLSSDARIREMFRAGGPRDVLEEALRGGSLYPLGLILTLELTLRRTVP
jgi:asparagine synthase (glutamine-hydrolysing)